MNKEKKKDKYYAMLYNAVRVDSGVITFVPNKLISGFYDADKNTFYRDDVDGDNSCEVVDIALPSFGKNELHILNALEDEIEDMDYNDGDGYFAFPITLRGLEEYAKSSGETINTAEEMKNYYERITRSYLLSSIYDEKLDDNVMLLTDKYSKEGVTNVNTSIDAIAAFETSAFKMMLDSDLEELSNGYVTEDELKEYYAEMGIELIIEYSKKDGYKFETKVDDDFKTCRKEKEMNEVFKPIITKFNPDTLERKINGEVIGQEHVARTLVTTIYKNKKYRNIGGMKSNMLILGPSGCGKTELVRSISRHLDIPMVIFDVSSVSESGLIGNSTTQALKDLIDVCNKDMERAENGIVVFDEIDKLAVNGKNSGDNTSNKGNIQNELLKILEGDIITIPAENSFERSIRFNPKNVTFIGIGAAQDLIEEKKNKKRPIGFSTNSDTTFNDDEVVLEPEDLIKYGLKPELLRRLGVIKVVKNLNKDKLKDILKKSKISTLQLYRQAFKDVDNVKLICGPGFYDAVVEKASKEKTGASGLKRVVDNTLEIAVRKMNILKGKEGELHVSTKTISNPENFKLYRGTGKDKKIVYEYKEEDTPKVKKLTTNK